MKEKAYFIFRPRTVNDLTPQSHNGTWLPYTIVKTICLPKTEFENFAADLLADRQFIEDNAYLCRDESDCLLISDLQHSKELLIIPWKGCFVRYAAFRLRVQIIAKGLFQ